MIINYDTQNIIFLFKSISMMICTTIHSNFNHPIATQTGHPEFEKLYRIQMNGLEFLPVFLSSLWLCALTSQNDKLSGALGLTYAVGRVVYGLGYPEKRGPGFLIFFLSIVGLMGVSAFQFFKN